MGVAYTGFFGTVVIAHWLCIAGSASRTNGDSADQWREWVDGGGGV
jgi:hypothetical protein